MPKAGEIRYCPELGGQETNAAFVWVPPGSFWMGDKSRSDNPVHFVVISKGFWLQQTPLKERQYSGQSSNQIQANISWVDVSNFCQGKPLRMPTEAEWEYAARANTGHKYLLSGSNNVDQRKSNNFGVLDMSRNMFAWCHDLYEGSVSTVPQVNPTGPTSGPYRVLRGSSWSFEPTDTRVAFRDSSGPDYHGHNHGVRLIWEPKNA